MIRDSYFKVTSPCLKGNCWIVCGSPLTSWLTVTTSYHKKYRILETTLKPTLMFAQACTKSFFSSLKWQKILLGHSLFNLLLLGLFSVVAGLKWFCNVWGWTPQIQSRQKEWPVLSGSSKPLPQPPLIITSYLKSCTFFLRYSQNKGQTR